MRPCADTKQAILICHFLHLHGGKILKGFKIASKCSARRMHMCHHEFLEQIVLAAMYLRAACLAVR